MRRTLPTIAFGCLVALLATSFAAAAGTAQRPEITDLMGDVFPGSKLIQPGLPNGVSLSEILDAAPYYDINKTYVFSESDTDFTIRTKVAFLPDHWALNNGVIVYSPDGADVSDESPLSLLDGAEDIPWDSSLLRNGVNYTHCFRITGVGLPGRDFCAVISIAELSLESDPPALVPDETTTAKAEEVARAALGCDEDDVDVQTCAENRANRLREIITPTNLINNPTGAVSAALSCHTSPTVEPIDACATRRAGEISGAALPLLGLPPAAQGAAMVLLGCSPSTDPTTCVEQRASAIASSNALSVLTNPQNALRNALACNAGETLVDATPDSNDCVGRRAGEIISAVDPMDPFKALREALDCNPSALVEPLPVCAARRITEIAGAAAVTEGDHPLWRALSCDTTIDASRLDNCANRRAGQIVSSAGSATTAPAIVIGALRILLDCRETPTAETLDACATRRADEIKEAVAPPIGPDAVNEALGCDPDVAIDVCVNDKMERISSALGQAANVTPPLAGDLPKIILFEQYRLLDESGREILVSGHSAARGSINFKANELQITVDKVGLGTIKPGDVLTRFYSYSTLKTEFIMDFAPDADDDLGVEDVSVSTILRAATGQLVTPRFGQDYVFRFPVAPRSSGPSGPDEGVLSLQAMGGQQAVIKVGEVVTYLFRLCNSGNAALTGVFSVSSAAAGWIQQIDQTAFALGPGACSTHTLTVTALGGGASETDSEVFASPSGGAVKSIKFHTTLKESGANQGQPVEKARKKSPGFELVGLVVVFAALAAWGRRRYP